MRISMRPQGRFPLFSINKSLGNSARSFLIALAFVCAAASAHAAVVRGTVTDRLGAVVRGARINLLANGQVVTSAVSGADGSYELTSANSGRFVVTGIGSGFGMFVSPEFYSGPLNVVTEEIVLKPASVNDEVTVVASGVPTPQAQLSTSVNVVHAEDLTTRVGIVDDLRMMPGVSVVQTGQVGGVTSLFVRGGASSDNKVFFDGVSAGNIGGLFDFGTISTTGLEEIQVARGPDSVIYGADATTGVLNFQTPRGVTARPVLNYSGDAGDFGSYRNEVTVSGTRSKLDYYLGFSRFDTSNALPLDRYHDATSVANLGYGLGSTLLRFTLHNSVSASGTPNAHDFYGISEDGKLADQNLYAAAVIENRTPGDWHNLVRYGISRKREQDYDWFDTGNIATFGCQFGNVVTIRGANGTSATGQAVMNFSCFGGDDPGKQDEQANNRDGLTYQTDFHLGRHTSVFGSFGYENERGLFTFQGSPAETVQRTNYDYGLEVQGDVLNRLFYSLGGAFIKNQIFGTRAEPKAGLAYYVVRPGKGFRGTKVRFNFSKNVREADLFTQLDSLRATLLEFDTTGAADVQKYNIQPVDAQTVRAYEGGVDQSILGQKLLFKGSYFHNEFGKQVEFVSPQVIEAQFNIPTTCTPPATTCAATTLTNEGGAYVNTLAYRAWGLESELEWRPLSNLFFSAGYTHLETRTQNSFSSNVLNPVLYQGNPKIPIGQSSPLIGGRAFRRPPNSGYLTVEYIEKRWTDGLKIAMVSRSDDTTALSGSDINFGNSLLLPNRDLAYGWVKVDINEAYQVTPRVGVFLQLDNLLNDQHIGPIGYPGMPFSYRAGVKVRLGGS